MKNTLITIVLVLLAAIVGAILYVFTFDVNSYKGTVERYLMENTGYSVSVNGKMSLSKSLKPTLILRDVEIKNAAGFSKPAFFKAERADISFELIPFLKHVLNVQHINLTNVNVFFQVNEAGHDNWSRIPRNQRVATNKKDLKRPTLSKAAAVTPESQAQFEMITLNDVKVHYENELEKVSNLLVFDKVSIEQLVNIQGDVLCNGEKFDFSGSVKNLLSVARSKRDFNFSFDVVGLDATSKVSGVCRDLERCYNDITLNITSRGKDLKKVYDFFFSTRKEIPASAYAFQFAGRLFSEQLLLDGYLNMIDEGVNLSYNIEQGLDDGVGKGRINLDITKPDYIKQFKLKPFTLQATYNFELDKFLKISNFSAMFDETDIDGSIDVDLSGKKPLVSGGLHSHYFKFGNVFDGMAAGLSWLDIVDANLSLTIDNFAANNAFARYPLVAANVQINDNFLEARLLEGSSVAGGLIVGKMNINARDIQNPKWSFELVGEDLRFNQVKSWKKQLLNGSFNVNLFLSAEGNTPKKVESSLNGSALFTANQVEILSPIVADLFAENDTNGTYRASKDLFIKCSVVNADIKNGIISLDKKAAVETSRFNMLIDGDINLADETINLRFIPRKSAVNYGQTVGNIRGVVLSGNLFEPKASVETKFNSMFDNEVKAKPVDVNSKKAVLDAYTNKKPVEEVSICRIAAADMNFKTIDDYFGRLPVVIQEEPEEAPQVVVEETKAEKVGRELLNALSDALKDKEKKPSPAGRK
ncbi:MAG: AsmA family protein [Alphaproteobacteria bacterium]|nr:AsmA family protein [Alphaproteobacteria bacterium]